MDADLERSDVLAFLGSAIVRKDVYGEAPCGFGGSGGESSMVAIVLRFEVDCALERLFCGELVMGGPRGIERE